FHNRRLNQRYQCHVGIRSNRNGSQQFRRQFGGDKDGGRTVSTTDNTDGSGLLNGEIHQPNITEESRAKQGTKDTELRSCTQQQGFRIRQQRAKIGHGTHTHKDQQRRNTTGNGDLIEGVQNAILETGLRHQLHRGYAIGTVIGFQHRRLSNIRSNAQNGTQTFQHGRISRGADSRFRRRPAHTGTGNIHQQRTDRNRQQQQRLKTLLDGQVQHTEGHQHHYGLAQFDLG